MVTKDLGMVTAYAYAVAGGYTGTEAEFTQLMADLAVVVDDFDNFSVNVTTLPAGSSATASYADGVLSLGIPKGDKGDKGNTGDTGAPAGFGTVSATVDDNIGTPSVEVTASGADTAKNFAFAFHNLKGQKGDKGDTGEVSEVELTQAFEDFSENGTVANAEQLTTDIRANDQSPYLFRTSGGSVDIGDREYINGIVGGTVAWNQKQDLVSLAANGGTLTSDNGVFSYTVTTVGQYDYSNTVNGKVDTYPSGHKIYLTCDFKPSKTRRQGLFFVRSAGTTINLSIGKECVAGQWTSVGTILAVPNGSHGRPQVAFNATEATGASVGDVEQFKNFMLFDLTQMFGSAIADYIYSLEQATAGAGVAFFKTLFPKPYYAYNAGELKSVSGLVSHDMTGFNQWDGVYENGYLDPQTGEEIPVNPTYYNSKRSSYIDVVGGATYYFRRVSTGVDSGVFWFYDADKNAISSQNQVRNGTFNAPTNARYMRWAYINMSIAENDICINLSWDGSRDGEYEPYVKHSYPLDSDLTLRGIPKIENGNLYYDGDVYEADGTVTRKYGIVDLGTLDWTYESEYPAFRATLSPAQKNAGFGMCVKYLCWTSGLSTMPDKAFGLTGTVAYPYLRIKDSSYTDAPTFKTAMSGVYLVYELATPTTETADPYTNPQIVNDFGTEEFVISNTVAVPIPVGNNTDYPVNLKAKVEMAPNSPDGDGDYIVRQTNGTNEYVSIANNATIQNILARLEALEG